MAQSDNFNTHYIHWMGPVLEALRTTDAGNEPARDGVVPIELIDGEQLAELFQDAGIGVKPKTIYEIDHAFFDEFRRTG